MTIRTMITLNQNKLIPSALSVFEFLGPYFEHEYNYIAHTLNRYGDKETSENDIDTINLIIESVIYSNEYKYKKLYETMLLEYNPIWNVDGTETTTTTHGTRQTTEEHSDRGETTIEAPISETYEHGEEKTTTEKGKQKNEDFQEVFPWDEDDKTNGSPKERNTTTESERTDTETRQGRTDKTTTSEKTKTANISGYSVTSSENEHQDITTLERHGNIGVTSTQNLIKQEREIAEFNLTELIIEDLIKCITIPLW